MIEIEAKLREALEHVARYQCGCCGCLHMNGHHPDCIVGKALILSAPNDKGGE